MCNGWPTSHSQKKKNNKTSIQIWSIYICGYDFRPLFPNSLSAVFDTVTFWLVSFDSSASCADDHLEEKYLTEIVDNRNHLKQHVMDLSRWSLILCIIQVQLSPVSFPYIGEEATAVNCKYVIHARSDESQAQHNFVIYLHANSWWWPQKRIFAMNAEFHSAS